MVAYALEQVEFLSTPSARRATYSMDKNKMSMMISIHALCEEGDLLHAVDKLRLLVISIHALCEEGDGKTERQQLCRRYFYPRPLRGGRPSLAHLLIKPVRFLSTPSARRATRWCLRAEQAWSISIHALCEEGD